jgi:methionyl-tRNA formyltransferase
MAVHRASVRPSAPGDEAGTLVAEGAGLALATGDGRLVLDEVQLAGRRPLSGAEFVRGHPELIGTAVGARATAAGAAASAGAGA